MLYYGLEWQSLDTYMQFKESTTPDTPPSNELRLYAKDSGGVAKLFYKDDAGVEWGPLGAITGSGAAGRVAYWSGAAVLSGEDNLFWDATNNRLGIGTATPGVQTTAGRQYLSIIGSSLSGHVEFLTAEADANDVLIGGLQYVDKNSSLGNKNRAAINANLSGATANQRGAYLSLYTSANASSGVTERARLTGDGQFGLGLGANTHTYKLEIWGANNDDSNFRVRTSTADTTGPGLNFQKSRGTALGSESAAQAADFLGAIGFGGYDGSAWQFNSVLMRAKAAELFSGSARGAHLLFETITAGGTTRSEKMRLASNGRLGIGSTDTVDPTVMLDIRGTGATVAVVAERDNGQPSFIGYRVRGGGTATQSGDMLTLFGGGGSHTGATADRATTALFAVYAGENWGSGAKGAYCTVETTPVGSTTRAERLRIEASGDISHASGVRNRMLSQNRFRYLNSIVRVVRTSAQTLSTATETAILFPTERIDTDGLHDTGSNTSRLTAAIAGKYVISGNVGFTSNATGIRYIYIRKNGGSAATDFLAQNRVVGLTANDLVINVCTVAELAAGDYVELFAFQNSGGNLNTTAANDSETNFEMAYIGE